MSACDAEPGHLELDGSPLSLAQLSELYGRPLRVTLAPALLERVDAGAEAVRRIAAGDVAVYGVNTGVGQLCHQRVSREQLDTLQENLIVSHAVGVGPPAPPEVVRWMMLFKLHALGHGVSGVRRETMQTLATLLSADALPVIPTQGSLGASGDLAPLAHMVMPLLGRGRVTLDGDAVSAAAALDRCGITPLRLGPKEGLALLNGTQFMSAYGAALLVRARRLLKHADIIACMSLEALCGSVKPFDEQANALRPHPGAVAAAANVRRLMADSKIVASHAGCDRVQDPYSLRCVAAVHGASRDAVAHVCRVVETEINAVTDNPIVFSADRVISGGNFHGQPLALALDYLAIALAELGSISERRTYLLLSGVDGLPPFLIDDTGVNTGFMVTQYTAAALVGENRTLATPASVDSIPTSMGQEDHVSMGATAATKAARILDNVETVLAIEQLCAAQGLDFRAPLQPGPGPRAAHEEMRSVVSHADKDREFGADIHASLSLLRSQAVVRTVEQAVGELQ